MIIGRCYLSWHLAPVLWNALCSEIHAAPLFYKPVDDLSLLLKKKVATECVTLAQRSERARCILRFFRMIDLFTEKIGCINKSDFRKSTTLSKIPETDFIMIKNKCISCGFNFFAILKSIKPSTLALWFFYHMPIVRLI